MPPTPEQNDPRKQQLDEFDRLLNSLTSGQSDEKLSPDIQSTMRIAIPKESDWLARTPKLEGATQSVPIVRQEERIPLPAPEADVGTAGTAEHPTATHAVAPPSPPPTPQPQYAPPPPPRAVAPPQRPLPPPPPAPAYVPQQLPAMAPPAVKPRASARQQTLFAALLVFAIFLLIALSAVLYFDLRLPSAG